MTPHTNQGRGLGIGAAMTCPAASNDPSLPALLLARDDGRPLYLRLGFCDLLRLTIWEHEHS
jgi:hypothetical protein